MENPQEIFIKARDSDYLHDIIRRKDWPCLIEFASSRSSNLISVFFETDESKLALKEMSEEQILQLIDTLPAEISNKVLNRMESFCDSDSKFTEIATKLMNGCFTHGGDLNPNSIVKCLPLNILRIIQVATFTLQVPAKQVASSQFFFNFLLKYSKNTSFFTLNFFGYVFFSIVFFLRRTSCK